MKILVIEDQEPPLEAFKYHLSRADGVTFDVAKWYIAAEKLISEYQYDVIFLDHRMPYEDPGCTDTEDFDRFCDQLKNIGYGLLPLIKDKQPGAIVIGTSSLSNNEIGRYTIPERTIVKYEAWKTLPEVLKELMVVK